jgi:hypothetical protein
LSQTRYSGAQFNVLKRGEMRDEVFLLKDEADETPSYLDDLVRM